MSDEIFFDGKRYISAHEAGSSADLTRDYVARLCREGKISGRRVGTHWYVEQASLKEFLVTQEYAKSRRSESLAKERTREYQATTAPAISAQSVPPRSSPAPLQSPALSTDGLSRASHWNSVETHTKAAVGAKVSPVAPVVAHASRVISSRADEIKNKMALAVAGQTRQGLGQAKYLFSAPGGLAHAALSAAHVPVSSISPVTEFIHKVVALTLTLMLTFGTYAAVDPSYARFAADSVRENVHAAVDSYHAATGGGLNELANRTQTQVAAAAENPGAALASVQSAFTEGIQDLAASFARALNSHVNDIVYAIAFPIELVVSRGVATRNENGSVTVSVEPYTSGTKSNIPAVASTQPSGGSITQHIVNNPVVERVVETTRLLSVGGISEELLDKKLADLDRKLSSQMLVSAAANTTNITNVYASAASAARIEHLDGLDLTNPTITGGSITNVTITGGSIAASALSGVVGTGSGGTGTSTSPAYGLLLLGNSAGGYDLVATSSLGIISGASLSAANTWTALQLFSAGASSTSFSNFDTAYFGGTATTTIDSTGTITVTSNSANTFPYASSTALTATNLFSTNFLTLGSTTLQNFTGLNATTTNATSTNLFATTASSTNLFSTTASFGTLAAASLSLSSASTSLFSVFRNAYFGGTATSTFDSTGFLTLPSGFLSQASSTIGNGTQAGGLTISGGATTTGDFVISKASAPTTGSLYFGNGTANINYNSSDFTFTGGSIYTAAGRITSIGNNETIGLGVRYVNGDGTYYVGASHSASPDLIFTNNALLERARLSDAGNFGIGTTSPYSLLALHANNGGTNTTLFSIASSTASATSTLFSISNTGAISATGAITSTAGTANTFPYASSTALTATNLFSTNFLTLGSTTLQNFTGLNATTTNATSTNLFATTASSTNLFSTTASFGTLAAASLSLTNALTIANGGTGAATFGQGWIYSSGGTGALAASTSPTVNYLVATSTTATTTLAGGLKVGSNYLNVLQNGNIGIGTAAPTVGLDVGVATKISGDLTLSGGSALTISATGPVNQTGTGQVTFAGNVDATNGLDVTNANFTVGGSNFTVAQSTGNTLIAGTLGLTGAFNASSTLQATGAARFYSTLYGEGAITAAGSGTGLSVTNNASIGGTLTLTGAGTFSSTLAVSGLLTAATSTFLGDVAFSGKKITGVASPSSDQDAANKVYVDSVAQGLSLKDSVKAGTTANIVLSGEQTVDGVSLVAGDRVLVKDQADQTKNGIYVVSSGVWSRSTDADISSEVTSGMFAFITDGTLNSSSGWVLTTTGTITLGTSLLTFTQFSGAGQITAGTGLTKSGNTLNAIGTTDRITANADSIDIASTYVGQTSITTVGTLTSGSLGSGFGNINIGASSITGGVATFSSIVGSAINGTGNLSISGSGTFTTGLTVVGTLTAATSTFSGDVALGGKKITGLANPTSAQEAATKAYVDAIAQGLTVKASVRAATTTNITLSGTQTIDGVAVVAGNRILVMGQSTASQNGIYDVAAGAWSRSSDANENSEVSQGMYAFVEEGTANANTGWSLITSGAITLDTTSLSFTQFSGSAETTAGDGLTKTGNTFNAVGTTDRISVTADAVDIAATYAGQSSLVTVGTLTAGAIGSGFGAINIGSSALTAGASVFSSGTSYGTFSIGGTATTSIVGNSATSTFSGGISLAGGNLNLATGGTFLINNVLALNATTLGSSVVNSSLTSVGALDSGSITTGFGAINIGADSLDAGATTLSSLTVSGFTSLGRASSTLFSGTHAYFGGTATSTFDSTGFLTLPSGFLSQASSTIGSGTQTGGLTISGGATTTGNAYFAGNVGVGTSSPFATLTVHANSGATNRTVFAISSSTAAFATSTLFSISNGGVIDLFDNGSATSTLITLGGRQLLNASSSSGFESLFLGLDAGSRMTTGQRNSGFGYQALTGLTSGTDNVAFGYTALGGTANTGSNNTAFGSQALKANSLSASNNTAVGKSALEALVSGIGNTALGASALAQNTAGVYNIGIGSVALLATQGSYNVGIGRQAGSTITTGYSNVLIGSSIDAGNLTTGGNNIGIGTNVFFPSATASNQLNIGGLIFGSLPATSTAFALPTSGSIGIGTSSPFAKFAIQSNGGDTATTLFAIGSSTAAFATSTLFSISNTGAINAAGAITSTAGTANTFPYASSTALTATNLFSTNFLTLGSTTLQNFTGLNATTTNATTTTFAISGVTSALLSTNSTGVVVATTTVSDSYISDALTISGGTIGSNSISGTLTTTGTLTIGDNGDAVNFDTSTWDVTAGAFSGVTTLNLSGIITSTAGTANVLPYASSTAITTSGSAYFATSGGSVGIGVTSPLYQLSFATTTTDTNYAPLVGFSNTTNPRYSAGIGSSHTTGVGQALNFFTGDSGDNSTALSGSGAIRMTLTGAGLVGVGTTTPFSKLQIADSSASATFKAQVVLTDTNGGTDAKHVSLASVNGEFRVGTTSDAYATSTLFSITNASTTFSKALYSSSAATSSFANGVNLTSGCWAIAGACIGTGSGSSNWTDAGAYISPLTAGDGILVNSASSTITNLVTVNATSTNATSTTLAISSVASALLSTNALGVVVATSTVSDVYISDAITVSGGTIGSNTISSGATWTTAGTLTIGDNGDAVNFNTSTWDVTAGAFSGVTTLNLSGIITSTATTANVLPYASSTAITTSGSAYFATTGGSVGIGTTTPWGFLSVNPNGITGPSFVIGSSTATKFIVDNAGNVGIGTTSPFRKFSLSDTVSTAQAAIAYDATRYAEFRIDTSGDLNIGASNGDTFFNNDNLWVCTGGSITTNGCPSGTPTGAGNIIAENKIGIGTTTPAYKLTIYTSDTTTNFLQIASSSGPTSQGIFVVNANGYTGMGTTSPRRPLHIENSNPSILFYDNDAVMSSARPAWFAGASDTGFVIGTTTNFSSFANVVSIIPNATGALATSTFSGDIKITGKLDVGTIDPVYTIDGVKYATYGHSTIGIHEETMQTIQLTEKNADGKYTYTIDFDTLEEGSDLWLFYQVTDMGQGWKGLVVSLTPAFDGKVFYEKDVKNNRLVISGEKSGEVSMRLTAYRYDFTKWKNLRPDQDDGGYKGHEISSKPLPASGGIDSTQQLNR